VIGSSTSAPKTSRRGSALRVAFAFAASLALSASATAQSVPMEQLMAAQPLPDIVQGSADAPVTIVEYASMTCPHCQAFHAQTWPTLKSKYVDTGKVKFIFREFPLDPLAAAAAMLARCEGPEKRNAVVDLLFDRQKEWAYVDKPLEALAEVVKQTGMTQKDFESCLQNQQLYDEVKKERDDASKNFHVNSTPTFFVNGQLLSGEMPIAEFDKAIAPLLK
jgi:protein-disulfide isomerase